jgi:uncharacterized protein (TIRG00374 family)
VRIGRRTLLRALLGIGVSLVSIWILIQAVDISAALDVLATASLPWVLLMVGLIVLDLGARGARWRALLWPIARLPYPSVAGYTSIGYLANNVLPARMGELFRSHALGEGENVSRTTVLGTVVVERIVDTVIVVGLAALAVVVLSVRGIMTSAVLLGAAFVTLLVVGLGIAMALHRLPGADRLMAYAARWPRSVELARRLREGLAVAARPRTLGVAIAFSALAWSASVTTFIAGGQAVGVELTLAQGALLSSGVALATIVPSGPGYLGTFELTAVGIATQFGIPSDDAFAMALLVHLMILAVTSIAGLIAAWLLRVPPIRARATPG